MSQKLSYFVIYLLFPINLATPEINLNQMANRFVIPIKDFLEYIEKPLKLTIMVCWNIETRIEFAKDFIQSTSKRDFQFSFTEILVKNVPKVLDDQHNLIILDKSCNQTKKFLKEIGISRKFTYLIINSKGIDTMENEDIGILEIFKDIPLSWSSEVYCMHQNTKKEFIFNQVYRNSVGSDLKIKTIEIYSNIVESRINKFYNRINLNRTVLRATLVITNNDTMNHLNDYSDRHIDTISKVCYFLTNYLADYVNGELYYKYENSWGYRNNETGIWSGMIGDLIENRSDIGASALFFTTDRLSVIEYIAMPAPTRSKFVFRSPKLSYTDNVFLLPFDSLVWYSLFGLIIVTAKSLLFASWLEWKVPLADSEVSDSGNLRPTILDTTLLVFGATCQQGSAVSPKSLTARIIMMITFTNLMFLHTSYSANIVALLQSPSNKIQTLEDLLRSRLSLGADDTVFNRYYFTHANESIRKKIYEQKIRNRNGTENFLPLADGVEKLREGLYAFHMEIGAGYKVVGETFQEDEKCGLKEIQYLQVIDPWYAIQKNSSYKELFKIGMMRINEHGLQERENSKLYTKKPKCVGGSGKFITASLVDTRPAILILIWGFFVAVFIFVLELIISKKGSWWKFLKNVDNKNKY